MTGQPPSSIVPEEPDPTLPTLPPDFPEHLLLQICDSILQPALSPFSPIRPHARPWIRASPARAPCKSDLLALCYANKRLYSICSDQIYRHIRVATLAVADMFVSRRNLLRNTSVLEFHINREQDITQAQTDLNLSRLFIQCGIVMLWSPALKDVLLDIKTVCDPPVLRSFFERFCQRVYIPSGTNKDEDSDSTPRWSDSQGVLNAVTRISVPRITVAIGAKAAGEVGDGVVGMLHSMFPLPQKNMVPRLQLPTRKIEIFVPNLSSITHLDLVLPRPGWGSEESEGSALGVTLARLTALKRLGLHASTEFGITRRPLPPSTTLPPAQIEEVDEDGKGADINIQPNGAVLYPATTNSGSTTTASVLQDTLGPETWWAKILAQIGPAMENLKELRISARGWMGEDEFDAWFATLYDKLARFPSLSTLIFDMEFSLPEPYVQVAERASLTSDTMYALYQTQYRWIRRLITPSKDDRHKASTASALRRVYFGEYQGYPGQTDIIVGPKKSKRSTSAGGVTAESRYAARRKNMYSSMTDGMPMRPDGTAISPGPSSPGVSGAPNPMGSRTNEVSMSSGQRIVPGMWWAVALPAGTITQGWADD